MLKLLGKLILVVIGLGILAAVLVPKHFETPQPAQPASAQAPPKQIPPEAITPSMREAYANRLEANYLDNGMDVHVRVQGKKKDSITLKYVLFSRPAVHKIHQDGKLLEEMRQLGFRKAVLADGYDTSWTFDLTK